MSTEHVEKIATRAVIVIDNKVLLGKRGRGSGENKYALIGGKPEGSETPENTIVREVEEETGLTFTNPVLWKEIFDSQSVPGEHWHIYFFTGVATGELKLNKDEILDIIYVSKEDLSTVDIAFNHKEILTAFFNEL